MFPKAKTIRQELIDLLSSAWQGAREISQELHISEKEVYTHLEHVKRSARTTGKKLIIDPAKCLSCGYVFRERKRLTPPGHCPKCKKTNIRRPRYALR